MKKRIYLMRRNWRIAWLLLCLPLHLCIMAAWNGFRLKGNTDVPWEGDWENWLN